MANNGINGAAVALVAAGGILIYAGFKGKGVSDVARSLLENKPVETVPWSTTSSAVSGVASAVAGGSGTTSNNASGSGDALIRPIAFTLRGVLGLNNAAIAGILGNAQSESGISTGADNPNDEGAQSFGLFQWRAGRFENLKASAAKHGYKYDSLSAQLTYLVEELRGGYSDVYSDLKRVPNTMDGARQAADIFESRFEVSDRPPGGTHSDNAARIFGILEK